MKRTIKTILTTALTALATFCAGVYISCKNDKCATVTCVNGGSCDGGKCNCPSEYEGDKCEKSVTTKFIGNWGAKNETASRTEPSSFGVSISSGGGSTEVVIHNLHNYFSNVTATVSRDSIVIPMQTVQGKTVVGAGYIYSPSPYAVNGAISISYTVTDVATKVAGTETETWGG